MARGSLGMIRLEHITKVYHADGLPVRALSGIDLSISPGAFAVLAGPSGSGKSTILHLIGALDRPSEGRVLIEGDDLYRRSRKELADFRLHKIGFVFQAYNLIPVLTARENVEYPLLLQRIPPDGRRARSEDLLRRVGLGDQSGKRPGEMSGGQQQRVAVARALAARPRIILADEPTANLDSKTGSELIDLFRELNEQYKVTFVFASHDPMVIRRAHQIVRLKDGRVEGEERQ
ncbi:MAG TPA: ABC transporter ATP-binding protein [bacterium]|nr:ABC transporter ATP-binding protein [bacterium]